jgi:AraC-like DNA-binding protein
MATRSRTTSWFQMSLFRDCAVKAGRSPDEFDRAVGTFVPREGGPVAVRFHEPAYEGAVRYLGEIRSIASPVAGSLEAATHEFPAVMTSFLSAPDLRTALSCALEFLPLLSQFGSLRIRVAGSTAELEFIPDPHHLAPADWHFALMVELIRGFAPEEKRRFACELSRPPLLCQSAGLAELLQGTVSVTQQSRSLLRFSCADLARPSEFSHPRLHEMMKGRGRAELADLTSQECLSMSVERLLRDLLKGASRLRQDAQLEDHLCSRLGMSGATLRRHLRTEGLSFRELWSAVRVEEAKRLLDTTTLSIAEISDFLGFAMVGCFTRFFREATGVNPSRYRQSACRTPDLHAVKTSRTGS